MLNPEREHEPRPARAELPKESTDTTSFANTVAAEYEAWETGSLAWLYRFFGRALTCYRKYRNDRVAYEELLELDYIAKLREKPDVEETSRLVLYKLTTAQDGARRNTAGRYARVVDYLFQQRIKSKDAAKFVEEAGGQGAILKLARGVAAPKDVGGDGDKIVEEDQEDQAGDDEEERTEEADLNGVVDTDWRELFDRDKDLSIRLTDGARLRILGPDFPMRKPFLLECKKIYVDEHGQSRIAGRLLKRSPK